MNSSRLHQFYSKWFVTVRTRLTQRIWATYLIHFNNLNIMVDTFQPLHFDRVWQLHKSKLDFVILYLKMFVNMSVNYSCIVCQMGHYPHNPPPSFIHHPPSRQFIFSLNKCCIQFSGHLFYCFQTQSSVTLSS